MDFEYFRGYLGEGAGLQRRQQGRLATIRDPVATFNLLILHTQHNLSGARMEFMIRDRLSWVRFLGFHSVTGPRMRTPSSW